MYASDAYRVQTEWTEGYAQNISERGVAPRAGDPPRSENDNNCADMAEQKKINIRNKRATFDYEILEEWVAGVVLVGTEIKSIRAGKASMTDSYCYFDKGELWIRGVNIAEYDWGTCNNHAPRREMDKAMKAYKR